MINLEQGILAGNTLVREAEQSQNYVPGVSGWQITAAGDAEFNNVTIRGKIIGGTSTGRHIEINGVDVPNGIGFYTGDAAQTFPGVIQPNADVNSLSVTLSSPLITGHSGASISLNTDKSNPNSDSLDLGAANVSSSASQTNYLYGPLNNGFSIKAGLDKDGTGPYSLIDAPRIYLQDTTTAGTTNTNGLVVVGRTIDAISNAWQSITNLSGMTGGTAFVNSWTDTAGARFRAYKDATGRVTIQGQIRSGTAGQIMTMPVGWRPSSNLEFTMRAGAVVSAVSVSTTGVLTCTANLTTAASSGINVDVISYPTA